MEVPISRLVYLAAHSTLVFPRIFERLIESGDLIANISRVGLGATASDFNIPLAQLNNLYEKGESQGPYSDTEFRMLLSQAAMDNLELRREEYKHTDYMKIMSQVTEFGTRRGESIITTEEAGLDDEHLGTDVTKWSSGFTPFDLIIGGFYQGVVTIAGKSGSGKTTIMLALMNAIRKSGMSDEAWFYEAEIPLPMMMYRIKQIAFSEKAQYNSKDRMICGLIDSKDILHRLEENPNPNRILFIDGPDVMAGGGGEGEGKRYALEDIYRDLVKMKMYCKLIVVSSQVKRSEGAINVDSLAESSSKAWYSDIVVGVKRGAPAPLGMSSVVANVPKNRFGIPDKQLTFQFGYGDFTYKINHGVADALEQEEEW